jgi:hypothetical protein
MALAAAAVITSVLPAPLEAAQSGAIRGTVRDSRGFPLGGALVVATPIAALPGGSGIAFTDSRGVFIIPNLRAAAYEVRVSMALFLAKSQRVLVDAGISAELTVNLQTPPDEKLNRARSQDIAADQHIISVLRHKRSGQPLLRYAPALEPAGRLLRAGYDYTGFVQLYSGTVETAAGITDGVGSQFSVSAPVSPDLRVTFRGRFSELSTETNAFEAAVELASSESRRSRIGVSVRQNGFGGAWRALDMSREVRLQYGDSFKFSRDLAFDYGAQLGSIEAYNRRNYVRPNFAVAWSPTSRTKLRVGLTSQTPAIYDVTGGKNGLGVGAYEPFAPGRRFHGEVVLAHLSERTTISVAAFGDRSETQNVIAAARGERKLVALDGRRMTTNGARVELKHDFRTFSAGVSYTNAMGVGLRRPARSLEELVNNLSQQRFHMVTTRVHANVPMTSTQLTATYRWMPNVSAVPIDPYQTFSESNEPTLSVVVAQGLPSLRPFGGRVQAVVDARNLLEPSLNGRRIQLAQSPRLIKGGLNIQF